MQSSTATVFRALVMLACLVAIPLAAVVGKSLPEMVKGLVDVRWPWSSASAYGSLGEAPRFEPAAAGDSPAAGSAEQIGPGWQEQRPQPAPSRAGGVVGAAGSSVIAAGYVVPVGPASGYASPARQSGGISPSGRVGGPLPVGPNDLAAQARSTADQFTRIQDRLRQLGATYYLLESWGNREQLYRFYCKVAVGGNANYTHYFEATDADPLRAMARVLQQVEGWKAGRKADGGRGKAEGF